jgi:hypothetical protein
MAIAQAVYGLVGRQAQGFLQSVFELMRLDLSAVMKGLSKSSASLPARTTSATPKPCQIYFRTCTGRSNKSAPTTLTTGGNATARLTGAARRYGGSQTQKPGAMRVTRICGAPEGSGASNASGRVVIITEAWRGPRSSSSRRSSAIGCKLGMSAINSKSCYSRV